MGFEELKTDFRDNLSSLESIAIGYHSDADGMTAAVILARHLIKQGMAREDIHFYSIKSNGSRSLYDEQLEELDKIDGVLYVDSSTRDIEQISRLVKQGKYVANIDHHGYIEGMENAPTIFINTTDEGIPGRSSSELMQELVGDKNTEWLAQVGLCGDMEEEYDDEYIKMSAKFTNFVGLADKKGKDIGFKDETNTFLNQRCRDVARAVNPILGKLEYFLSGTKAKGTGTYQYNGTTKIIKGDDYTIMEYYFPESEFDLAEILLKTHIPTLEPNTTVVLYTGNETETNIRLYTSADTSIVNCEEICKANGGGGHPKRGGTSTETEGYELVQKITQAVVDCYD
jgi:hypothetical protein